MEVRLIRMPEVVQRIGLSRPTVYRLIQRGEFPSPVRRGRTSAWLSTEIDNYLAQIVQQRIDN